jgi:hypothetical protein
MRSTAGCIKKLIYGTAFSGKYTKETGWFLKIHIYGGEERDADS